MIHQGLSGKTLERDIVDKVKIWATFGGLCWVARYITLGVCEANQ